MRGITTALGFAMGMAVLLGGGAAQAQSNYPNRAIHIVVPYPAGGIVDIVARTVTEQVGRDWKQTVVVEARPGGNSNIGTAAVARSDPDGYTWLVTGPAALVNPTLYKDAGWDAMKDLKCVGLAVWNQSVALVHPSMPVKTIGEFVELARSKPGEFNFGNPGTGSSIDLSAQKLFQVANIKLTNVGYKGQPPALIDLMTNLMHFRDRLARTRAAAHQGRHGQAACRVHRQTRRRSSGRADDRGSRISRSRLRPLVRHLCAINDARRHRRKDQRGHQQGAAKPGRPASAIGRQHPGQADVARANSPR